MRQTSFPYLLVLSCLFLFALTFASARADNAKTVKPRQIRVTTGISEVHGWEQGLIQKNPNLARWHWDTIYSYKQGYGPLTPHPMKGEGGGTTKQIPAKSNLTRYPSQPEHYDKPTHVPYSPDALAKVKARLIPKPVPAPVIEPEQTEAVSGTLHNPQQPNIATYKNVLPATLNTSLKYNTEKTAVYGQLLKGKKKK